MEKLRLLYVHGFSNDEGGEAFRLLKAELDKRGFSCSLDAPRFPLASPPRMKKTLDGVLAVGNYDYMIASSLAALYAMQTFGPYIILLDPASPDGQTEKLRRSCETYFDVFHDAESEFMTYFVYGKNGNESFFDRYYHDGTHVFRADMERGLNESCAAAVCDVIEKVEAERPTYERRLEDELCEIISSSSGKSGGDKTVLGFPVEEFVGQNTDKTLAEALGDEHCWYAYYKIDSLGLSRHTYYRIRRLMDPPICRPSGSHLTMDELLGLTVSRIWNAPAVFEDAFIEVVEKADAWLKAWHARTGS